MEGAPQDRGTCGGIARTLLALAFLAERTAGRSFPVRFLVLSILFRAEAIARIFVTRSMEADCPGLPCPDLLCFAEQPARHHGAADAGLLALRLRMLAAVLAVLSVVDDCAGRPAVFPDDRSTRWPANRPAVAARGAGGAPFPPLLLVVRLPAARRRLRPPDIS
jgi:hypothetical protein